MNYSIAIPVSLFIVGRLGAEAAPESARNSFVLEQDADVVIYYTPGNDQGGMEISVGPQKDNKPPTVIRKEKFSATSEGLARFFDQQPRKNLIVIVYRKNQLEDVECKAIATKLKDYFLARGYKRISIQQATAGLSRPVYMDYQTQQAGPTDGEKQSK